ncbi:uncharacterized protein GIQ15_04775 [Arthroderma uncinatum]|uniref:uncharacterized protein n=1 Tax=Arthroderma uncinatum TaxID=74035 RepID=UPI00144A5191|nr:uncharacterized protein GIQ15_04775 [Arthroderma uncinatum]KAF3482016.1 hypothetical protein GIQ15_04775 [Arthroderma uncinatum]
MATSVDSTLLIGLPEGTPRIKYTTMRKLKNLVDKTVKACSSDTSHNHSPFIVAKDIPPTILEEFDKIYPDKGPRLSANIKERILLLKITSGPGHETAVAAVEYYINRELEKMNLDETIIISGSTRATGSTSVKEPDGGFTRGHHSWPTLVIEGGASESATKLKMDAQWWLESNESITEIALTIEVSRDSPTITFQKWERPVKRE